VFEVTIAQEPNDFDLEHHLWSPSWEELDEVMAAVQFEYLSRVTLSFLSHVGQATPVDEDLRLMLPRLSDRGILSVVDIIC
jgi:hypothetical protein